MPAKSPPVADPKTELVPMCSVRYDATWPKRTRLLWIIESARWYRGQIPRMCGWRHQVPTGFAAQHREELMAAIQGVRELWTAALAELPKAVTGPRNALRDGFNAHLSADAIEALLADLTCIEDEATPLAETVDVTEPSSQEAADTHRGRLPKADSEAKQSFMLAKIREHDSLKYDPAALAKLVGVGESTIRRWLEKEERKYLDSKAARPETMKD